MESGSILMGMLPCMCQWSRFVLLTLGLKSMKVELDKSNDPCDFGFCGDDGFFSGVIIDCQNKWVCHVMVSGC